ncbi:hypothetical protein ANCCAN_06960 [Ancylostoma caninum]|uniref:DNA2/NAM7 helicase-like C-terminal domain-containing protein n=1 Tax=Ancylostoma caninum TaxID=29170 RepID=A0A368GUQ2_ANCCA|nr:hypothetical protein ANCCAN_06960 [Ancylostoma caninum]
MESRIPRIVVVHGRYPVLSKSCTTFNIRNTSKEHQELVKSKLHKFDLFEKGPNEVIRFLGPLYSTACGTIAAAITDTIDTSTHSAIWTSPNLNSFPVLVNFRVPIKKKTGWAVGRPILGAYEADFLQGQIVSIEMTSDFLRVTAKLDTSDGVRFRMYILNSTNRRVSVGTTLHTLDERANPVLAMLESASLARLFRPDSLGWQSARALLAGDVELKGTECSEKTAITVNVAGSQVQLNEDQVNAVNLFNKEFPILVVDSAYGAGKSLCTAVMAKEAVEKGQTILVAVVQNSALDVIGAKIAQLQSKHIKAVRYVNEILAQDATTSSPFALHTLMENFHITHRHLLTDSLYRKFERFSEGRRQMREFMFTGVQGHVVTSEHKKLMFLEERTSSDVKVLIRYFLKLYKPNIYLCTISAALNLTLKKGNWRIIGNSWKSILLDEASMIPEAALMTLMSRFQGARVTLIGDSKQLPPYIGIHNIPLAVAVSSRSVLDVVRENGSVPMCRVRIVYRPHKEMMQLNSSIFYDGSLTCGTPPHLRQALLTKVKMPNPKIPVALVDVPSLSVKSVTGSHSNTVEANAANMLTRLLIAKGMNPADILVICLYRDQKFMCENKLQGTGVIIGTVDSAQGKEQSVVIVCTTRTHVQNSTAASFFSDARRLNVALSRARDGMFIIASPYFFADNTNMETRNPMVQGKQRHRLALL